MCVFVSNYLLPRNENCLQKDLEVNVCAKFIHNRHVLKTPSKPVSDEEHSCSWDEGALHALSDRGALCALSDEGALCAIVHSRILLSSE